MRRILTILVLLMVFQGPVLAQPAAVQKENPVIQKIVDFFEKIPDFFKIEKDVDPSGTLVAPFADPSKLAPLTEQQKRTGVLPTNQSPLNQSHRSAEDLAKWLLQAIPQILSFTTDSWPEHVKILSNGFSDGGLKQYEDWVSETGIMASLQRNGLQLNGFVTETPFLLNEGVVNGRYRWLFEIPVMVSFVPRGTVSYAQERGVKTQHLLITLQLGRVADSILEHAVDIESWSVQDNRRKN